MVPDGYWILGAFQEILDGLRGVPRRLQEVSGTLQGIHEYRLSSIFQMV